MSHSTSGACEGQSHDFCLQTNSCACSCHTIPTQAAALAWVEEQWPDYTSPIWRAAKLGEEAGEVLGAVIKSHEGVGGKTLSDVAVETAQVVICAMALAESVGFDLWKEVIAEFRRCHSRVWEA